MTKFKTTRMRIFKHLNFWFVQNFDISRLLKKWIFTGWSKTFRCKACEIMRNEAYFTVRRKDER
jgi:hypothetical protein